MGVLPTIAPYLLPRMLPRFSKDLPGIAVVVLKDTTTQLLVLLAASELDLAIASLPILDKRFEMETLFTEELLVALPPKHPLVKKPFIYAAENCPWRKPPPARPALRTGQPTPVTQPPRIPCADHDVAVRQPNGVVRVFEALRAE